MAESLQAQDLRRYAGRWIAWDRDQTHIVASAETFAALKTEAVERGQHSVLVARVPNDKSWFKRAHRFLHVFAVFIALGQPVPPQQSIADSELLDFRSGESRG